MTANHEHTPSLKEHVHKLVDDWLGLGDLDDRPIEGESDFEQWVDQKIKAGNELSSFAEEVLDEFLGQFKGTKRDVGVELDRIIAAAEQRGAIKALQDLADNHTVRIPDILGYKVQAVFTETIWEKLDDLEGGDE